MKFILAQKVKMSQIFDEKGNVIPVTVAEAGPVKITQIKTKEKDGYEAVQIGFGKKKKISKPIRGHLKKLGNFRWLREIRTDELKGENLIGDYKEGEEIKVDIFEPGDKVTIVGLSKGKGFQGVVKRHGFHGSDASHGAKHSLRSPGSIGATHPQHVVKGKKMAGRTGSERITVKNREIVKVDKEKNLLYIKGGLPGNQGSLIEIFA